MKKILLLSAVFCQLAITAHAQTGSVTNVKKTRTDYRDRLTIGLKMGANISNVYDAEGEEFDNNAKIGFVGGAFVAVPIGAYFGIQPEILYSQKGFHATGRLLGYTYDFTRTTNFIDVPILFSIKPIKYATILVGPQYSYMMSQSDAYATGTTTSEQMTEFSNDNIRKNILSFTGGLDVNIKHLVLSMRACWDITKNNGNGTSTTPRYKNTWIQGCVGYRI